MDKALILWLALICPCFGQGILPPILGVPPVAVVHTFSFLHANSNTACSTGSVTCSVTTTSTTAGSLLAVWVTAGSSGTPTITGVSCSPSACNSGAAAFVHCSNCSFRDSGGEIVDGGYVLAAPSGVTSVAVTISTGTTLSFYIAEVDEVSYTGGGNAVFDNSGGAALTSCTSCAVTGVTLSGTKDYVSRDYNSAASSVTAPGAPWTNPGTITTTGVIGALNQTAAATFNVTQTAGVVAQAVMAFK